MNRLVTRNIVAISMLPIIIAAAMISAIWQFWLVGWYWAEEVVVTLMTNKSA